MKTSFVTLGIIAMAGGMTAFVWKSLNRQATTTTAIDSVAQVNPQPSTPVPALSSKPASSRARPVAAGSAHDDNLIGNSDPKSRDYDPMLLLTTANATPCELFQKEPRDPQFADGRESVLQSRLSQRLRERIKFDTKTNIDCHTSSCEVTVHGASSLDEMNATLKAMEPSGLASAAQIEPRAKDAANYDVNVVLLYSLAQRDPTTYDQQLKQHEARDASPTKP